LKNNNNNREEKIKNLDKDNSNYKYQLEDVKGKSGNQDGNVVKLNKELKKSRHRI